MNFYQDHLYVNFDINGSSHSTIQSPGTTPHCSLGRNRDRINNSLHNGLHGDQIKPRTLRNNSHNDIISGRTSSVSALSERSLTGMSSVSGISRNSERANLVPR